MDVLVDGRTQLAAAAELIQEIHLCLHNAPETFHWAIVDAMPNAGHGLLHTLLRELELERFVGILAPCHCRRLIRPASCETHLEKPVALPHLM